MRPYRTNLFRFLGFIVGLGFLLQIMSAQAEEAGLHSCLSHHGAQAEASCCPSEKALPAPPSTDHCPLCCHLAVTALPEGVVCLAVFRQGKIYFAVDEAAPDGPVVAIDYPPQLS